MDTYSEVIFFPCDSVTCLNLTDIMKYAYIMKQNCQSLGLH